MIKPADFKQLLAHLQTAIDVELSTVPIYLYTYYSIKRTPGTKSNEVNTFANKAGAVIMSVAVEEMLHMSLASNILKSLGGEPKIYGKSPIKYPTNLEEHAKGFSIGLTKLTVDQLSEFMKVEQPEAKDAPPQADHWDTLGQFYDYIKTLINQTEDSQYSNPGYQLGVGDGYYAANNIDTINPKNAAKSDNPNNNEYHNNDDSGNLKTVTCKQDAIDAINEIVDQGEGFAGQHVYDDKSELEKSHWYKYKELHQQLSYMVKNGTSLDQFVYNFPDSPVLTGFPEAYQPIVNLNNAAYSYLLWMTEMSFTLKGSAQSTMFYIGMHKGMIFILDKIIGGMRNLPTYKGPNGEDLVIAPSFENYPFKSVETAKMELVNLAEEVLRDTKLKLSQGIVDRIKDLPDVNVVAGKVSFA